MALEEQKWATEKDSIENHQKLLEDKVTHGYDDAMQKLKATQQQLVFFSLCLSLKNKSVVEGMMTY